MSASRVLITGAAGFVGAHLARRLAERGGAALGMGDQDLPASSWGPLERYWQADVRDETALESALAEARPTAIVHLAAQSSAARSFERPLETYEINAVGTMKLLEAVRRAAPRARLLVIGTGELYGEHAPGTRVAEEAPIRPVSPYALSKAASDAAAEVWARLWGLDVVRTRSFGHIGPGQLEPFLAPSVARQIAEIEAGIREPVVRVGNLEIVRDLSDARDVVDAYVALLARGRSGAAYNVCRGEGVRLLDLVQGLIARARVAIRIEVDPSRVRPVDIRHLVGDPTRIQREVGWKPAIELDQTLDEILDEWRKRAIQVGTS